MPTTEQAASNLHGRYRDRIRDASGRLCATRMAISVAAICFSDVLFAMDSVPVVLSLTTSPFLLVASQARLPLPPLLMPLIRTKA